MTLFLCLWVSPLLVVSYFFGFPLFFIAFFSFLFTRSWTLEFLQWIFQTRNSCWFAHREWCLFGQFASTLLALSNWFALPLISEQEACEPFYDTFFVTLTKLEQFYFASMASLRVLRIIKYTLILFYSLVMPSTCPFNSFDTTSQSRKNNFLIDSNNLSWLFESQIIDMVVIMLSFLLLEDKFDVGWRFCSHVKLSLAINICQFYTWLLWFCIFCWVLLFLFLPFRFLVWGGPVVNSFLCIFFFYHFWIVSS